MCYCAGSLLEWSPAPTKNKQVTACALWRTTAGMFSSCTRLRTGISEAGISETGMPAQKPTAKNPLLDLSLSFSVCLGLCACRSLMHLSLPLSQCVFVLVSVSVSLSVSLCSSLSLSNTRQHQCSVQCTAKHNNKSSHRRLTHQNSPPSQPDPEPLLSWTMQLCQYANYSWRPACSFLRKASKSGLASARASLTASATSSHVSVATKAIMY